MFFDGFQKLQDILGGENVHGLSWFIMVYHQHDDTCALLKRGIFWIWIYFCVSFGWIFTDVFIYGKDR